MLLRASVEEHFAFLIPVRKRQADPIWRQ